MHPKRILMIAVLFIGLLIAMSTMGPARNSLAFTSHTEATPGTLISGDDYHLRGGLISSSANMSSPLRLVWSRITVANSPLAVQAQVLTRTHSVSAAAFVRDLGSANVLMDNDIALRWAADVTDEAGFYFTRPPDWDRTSPIKVHIYFALGGNGAGAVNWRLKLNTYTPNSGEWLTNPGARGADTLLTFPSGPSSHRIYSQTFTLTDAGLANEPLWSFYFLRGNAANSETFTDYLYVLSADVEYLSAQ